MMRIIWFRTCNGQWDAVYSIGEKIPGDAKTESLENANATALKGHCDSVGSLHVMVVGDAGRQLPAGHTFLHLMSSLLLQLGHEMKITVNVVTTADFDNKTGGIAYEASALRAKITEYSDFLRKQGLDYQSLQFAACTAQQHRVAVQCADEKERTHHHISKERLGTLKHVEAVPLMSREVLPTEEQMKSDLIAFFCMKELAPWAALWSDPEKRVLHLPDRASTLSGDFTGELPQLGPSPTGAPAMIAFSREAHVCGATTELRRLALAHAQRHEKHNCLFIRAEFPWHDKATMEQLISYLRSDTVSTNVLFYDADRSQARSLSDQLRVSHKKTIIVHWSGSGERVANVGHVRAATQHQVADILEFAYSVFGIDAQRDGAPPKHLLWGIFALYCGCGGRNEN